MDNNKKKKDKKEFKIKIFIRIRPYLSFEFGSKESIFAKNETTLLVKKGKIARNLKFDYVFNKQSTQKNVFDHTSKNIIDSLIEGYNGSIFAYGQNGSGKSYSIQGEKNRPGLVYRCIEYILNKAEKMEDSFNIFCSYIEIYNEKIYDLLDYNKKHLEIREEPIFLNNDQQKNYNNNVFLPNVTILQIDNLEKINVLIKEGNKNRSVGVSNLNERSSRSHSIFQIHLFKNEGNYHSKLNLIDLAGSEKWNYYSEKKGIFDPKRMKEFNSINKSLSCLGKCVIQLLNNQNFINFRDSKLTRLLSDSFLNSNTSFIITLSPSILNFKESLSTLKFAVRAMNIIITADNNEDNDFDEDNDDDNNEKIIILKNEIKRLKNENKYLKIKLDKKDKIIENLKNDNNNNNNINEMNDNFNIDNLNQKNVSDIIKNILKNDFTEEKHNFIIYQKRKKEIIEFSNNFSKKFSIIKTNLHKILHYFQQSVEQNKIIITSNTHNNTSNNNNKEDNEYKELIMKQSINYFNEKIENLVKEIDIFLK